MKRKSFLILSFTWGIVLSLLGCIAYLILIIAGFKPQRYNNCLYFEVGEDWGGLELGWVFIVNKNPSTHILNHELGHGYQNCYYGIFFTVIFIWSFLRYHYRNIVKKINPEKKLKPYDSIWFEGQATALGEKMVEKGKKT